MTQTPSRNQTGERDSRLLLLSTYYLLNSRKGFSLLEMVVYIAILSLMMVVVVNTALSLTVSWNSVRISRDINSAAVTSLERMGRDIRGALGVNATESVFDTHPGILTLSGATTKEFYLDNGVLSLREDGVPVGALMKTAVTVTNLVFRRATSGAEEGVKIELTFESSRGTIIKTKNFYSFVALRASYQ